MYKSINIVDIQVFGDSGATRGLPAMIAVSALGNVIAIVFMAGRRMSSSHGVADCELNKKSLKKVYFRSLHSGLAIDHFELPQLRF